MKILLLDNGSSSLSQLRDLLKNHEVVILGFPFVSEILESKAKEVKSLIFSGEGIPAGIELPYRNAQLATLRGLRVPVLGIGYGGALLLEAHGAKIKSAGGTYHIKKAPESWKEENGVWRDGAGKRVILMVDSSLEKHVQDFLAACL